MAGGLFILPGVVAIMALSWIYALYGKVGIVAALFFGLKAAVLAVVLEAVVRIGRKSLKNRVMIGARRRGVRGDLLPRSVPFPIIVLVAGVIGFLGGRAGLRAFDVGGGHGPSPGKRRAALSDALLGDELPAHARPTVAKSLRVAAVWLALWLVPVARAARVRSATANVFSQIAIFFSKMAMVTFGGAYAVLAYVAQQAVENYGWLAARRDAGRARHGRDDAGAAHHGAAVRRLHGRLPRSRAASPAARRHARAACSPPG